MGHVFISYVRENSQLVNRLANSLSKYGINVWLDRDEIKPGQLWEVSIRDGITKGAFFIACFSKEYSERTSTYMNEELAIAMETYKFSIEEKTSSIDRTWFIPVILSECQVPKIRLHETLTIFDLHWVELYKDWEGGIRNIVSLIDPEATIMKQLIESLHSKSARARIQALDGLGAIGNNAAIAAPEIINLLDDENETVRAAAADALTNIGNLEQYTSVEIERLLKLIRLDEWYSSMYAVRVLINIGKPAIPALVEASKTLNHGHMTAIEKAINGICGADAVEVWKEIGTNDALENIQRIERRPSASETQEVDLSRIIASNPTQSWWRRILFGRNLR